MPYKPDKPCSYPGCPKLVPAGQTYCEEHTKKRSREYERYDRDNTHWESFGSPNANEWVYRVPLKMLP